MTKGWPSPSVPVSSRTRHPYITEAGMAEQRRLRWGILGTGNIANQFAAGVAASRRGSVVAVGSRSRESAEAFARPREIAAAHGSYDELLRDPNVDAVYNSLPNSMHHAWTIKALRAG